MAASVGGFLTRHHLVRAQWPVRRPGLVLFVLIVLVIIVVRIFAAVSRCR
jgi:hypothetical protein